MKIEYDSGYYFGKGVFETIKVVNRNPLFLERHLTRLKNRLDFFGIKTEVKTNKISQYIKNKEDSNYALKIIVSDKNFIITSRDDNYHSDYSNHRLSISEALRNSTSKLIYHKSLCYYENILEHNIAVDNGYNGCLFLNEKGEVTETSFSNIFFVQDKKIVTPKVECGLLKGTMRDYLIENYEVLEDSLTLDDLKSKFYW